MQGTSICLESVGGRFEYLLHPRGARGLISLQFSPFSMTCILKTNSQNKHNTLFKFILDTDSDYGERVNEFSFILYVCM